MRGIFAAFAGVVATIAAAMMGSPASPPVEPSPHGPVQAWADPPADAPFKPQFGWTPPKVVQATATSRVAPPARPEGAYGLSYREAHRIATAERRPLVVLAGPQADALAEAVAAEPDAVVAYGDPASSTGGGVYRYRWDDAAGELRGGAVPQAATVGRSGPVRWRCQGGVCTPY